jgi:hypothetical protein
MLDSMEQIVQQKSGSHGGKRAGSGRKPGAKQLFPCPWQCGKLLSQRDLLIHARHCERKETANAA